MRLYVLIASAAVALVGIGASALTRRASAGGEHWEVVKGLDDAFLHTANLRSGVGRCGVGIARRPGVPAAFHAETGAPIELPASQRFGKDVLSGLWTLREAGGSRFFADEAKKHPAGHLLVTRSSNATKVDARYLSGDYAGTAFHADTTIAADGSGTVEASGKLPEGERYTLVGCWNATNVGTWSQTWEGPRGTSEKNVYRTFADGTATLRVSNGQRLELDLTFAPNRSGNGTALDGKTGLKGKIEWDNQGDGTIVWADGATQAFENWKV